MTNKQVAQLFISGNAARAGRLWTDGQDLYSYDLKIGETRGIQKVVFNYTAKGVYQSQTTSTHVRLAERCGAKLIEVGA